MSDWQPIDTAPHPTTDDGWRNWSESEVVLIFDPQLGVRSASAEPDLEYPNGTHQPAILVGWIWGASDSSDSEKYYPTHWMPLPSPPGDKS